MRFIMKNIGMVEHADIEVKGLTVIAGENDTGKSTVAKMLYSITRGMSKYEEEFEQDREEFIEESLDKIYFALRREIDLSEIDLNKETNRDTLLHSFIVEMRERLGDRDVKAGERLLVDWKEKIKELTLPDTFEKVMNNELEEISKLLKTTSDSEQIKLNALNKVISSEFSSELENKYSTEESVVYGFDGKNEIFNLFIDGNEVTKIESLDTLTFNEAIYIETPLVLSMPPYTFPPFLRVGSRLRRRRIEPLHVYDLFERLYSGVRYQASDVFGKHEADINKFNEMIASIIGGTLTYQASKRQFTYTKDPSSEHQVEFELKNVASGIKALGLLQLLLKSGFFHHRSLLVIDEPEVHLHPKWQVEYARLLVQIVEQFDVSILLNSHSPYFIEAIKVFSDKAGIQSKTHFYFAEKNKGELTSTIENVTHNLEKIFDKLLEPFRKLEEEMFGESDD